MYDLINSTKQFFNPEEPPRQKAWYEEMEEEICSVCPSMTWQQRLIGCGSCIAIGFFISLGSLFRLIELIEGNPTPFAVMYSIGNIIALCSTCFLYGPWTQMKKMFASTRIIATVVYLFMIVITLFLAFFRGEIFLRIMWIVFAIVIQFLALAWYTLSYIPYAREIVSSCLSDTCCACKFNTPQSATSSWGL